MKLSTMSKAIGLANDRRELIMLLDSIEEEHEIEITIGGWPIEITDEMLQLIEATAKTSTQAALDDVERKLQALGVELDIGRDDYIRHYHGDDGGDDEPEDEAADEAEPEAANQTPEAA